MKKKKSMRVGGVNSQEFFKLRSLIRSASVSYVLGGAADCCHQLMLGQGPLLPFRVTRKPLLSETLPRIPSLPAFLRPRGVPLIGTIAS